MDLTDGQWAIIEENLPKDPVRADRRGRPWSDRRACLNGILWILRTGAPWQDLPDRYPPYQTVHRRFQNWSRSGALGEVLRALARDLKERGGLDLSGCFMDGSFAPAKKGAPRSAPPSGARVRSSWQRQNALVFLSVCALKALRLRR